VYTNVYTHKAKILAENRGKSGVYRFTNLTNNKTYVGCAVNLKARIYKYFRLKDLLRAKCMPICFAILKYKLNNFKLEILEYCNKEDCLRKENYYIDSLKPEYTKKYILYFFKNIFLFFILREGFYRLGTKHTIEAKAKIRAARLGKKLSEVTKARRSKALKDRTILSPVGDPLGDRETKEKMSYAKGGTGIDVLFLLKIKNVFYIYIKKQNSVTGETTTYVSGREAAYTLGCSEKTIRNYIKSGKLFGDLFIKKGVPGSHRKFHTEVRKLNNSSKPDAHVGKRSQEEMLVFDRQGRCVNAMKLVSDKIILMSAYGRIKSKLNTKGKLGTLAEIPDRWFEETSDKLGREKFQFKPTRRVYIPKVIGKIRPIGVESTQDKIVQEAFKEILGAILDKKLPTHGFKPKGHTVLEQIRHWKDIK
jgi:group I intron endonuclease